MSGPKLYGLMAEFENPQDLVEATRKAREAGFTKLDAYAPYPIEALTEALDIHDRKLPAVVLGGGVLVGASWVMNAHASSLATLFQRSSGTLSTGTPFASLSAYFS